MAAHNDSGKAGEALALTYFRRLGYTVLHTNWRFGKLEVDLIAERSGLLHFIEVKYRASTRYGLPETAVTRKKFGHLVRAATHFLDGHPQFKDIRFDILAIHQAPGQEAQFFLIEDVFLS